MPTTSSRTRTSAPTKGRGKAKPRAKAPAVTSGGPGRRPTAAAPRGRAKGVRAHRSPAALPRLPQLERHHVDLLGLGLVAVGVFLGFLLWAGWDGGAGGRAVTDGLRYLVGGLALLSPVALVAVGAIVVLGPVLPAVRPFRAGGICLLLSSSLALAAGTFGLGPGASRTGDWDASAFSDRGGVLGAAEHWLTTTLVGSVGTHLIATFGLLAGITLLTGASIASVLRTGATVAADTTQELRARGAARRERVVDVEEPEPEEEDPEPEAAPAPRRTRAKRAQEAERVVPPAFEDEEPVVRSGRMTELDGSLRYPDLWEGDARPLDAPDRPDAPAFAPVDDAPVVPVEEPFEHESHDFAPPEPTPEPVAEVPIRERPVLPNEPIVPKLSPEEEAASFQQGALDLEGATDWHLPNVRTMLKRSSAEDARPDTAGQAETARRLLEALGHFGVDAQVVGTVAGPHITRYELKLAPGIKMSKVAQMKDDLAYALAATDIRILAPIPGKTAVGVEVPNLKRKMVTLGDVLGPVPEGSSPLTVWLGKDVSGKPIPADLAKMPHILVAGTTGAGKSGCINAMLSSILLRATPDEVRLILVDPKQVELNHYEAVPHLLTPVITSPRSAANALQNLVKEMEWRYGIMSVARTRSLNELNRHRLSKGEAALPYILCVIDELADLMMVAPADVEDSIIRIAQKARAVGIHLVLATQSPRVDVITGMIKANVPSRIAFSVSSQTDSRVILDQNGAESLLGMGDMLFSAVGSSKLHRIQGAYIDEPQIAQLTEFWAGQGEPDLRDDLLEEVEAEDAGASKDGEGGFDPDEDPLLGEAIELVVEMGTASTSMLQRRLRLGYTRAGRLMDMLERRGVISGYEGSKPRQVLVSASDLPRVLAALAGGSAEPEAGPGTEAEAPPAHVLPDPDVVLGDGPVEASE